MHVCLWLSLFWHGEALFCQSFQFFSKTVGKRWWPLSEKNISRSKRARDIKYNSWILCVGFQHERNFKKLPIFVLHDKPGLIIRTNLWLADAYLKKSRERQALSWRRILQVPLITLVTTVMSCVDTRHQSLKAFVLGWVPKIFCHYVSSHDIHNKTWHFTCCNSLTGLI